MAGLVLCERYRGGGVFIDLAILLTYFCDMKRWILLFALLVWILPHDLIAQGCAMCKATVESQEQGGVFGGQQAIGAGLNKGIIMLMVVPYVLLFLFFRKRILGFFKEFAGAKG